VIWEESLYSTVKSLRDNYEVEYLTLSFHSFCFTGIKPCLQRILSHSFKNIPVAIFCFKVSFASNVLTLSQKIEQCYCFRFYGPHCGAESTTWLQRFKRMLLITRTSPTSVMILYHPRLNKSFIQFIPSTKNR
jgi:hypothetical protein